MRTQLQSYFAPQEYLRWERYQALRHEYVDGEVYAMSGASRKHNIINGNTFATLHAQLRSRPCEIYNNDMRVKIYSTNVYTYPDIVVACGQPMFEDTELDTLLNPILIIEILSVSTERYDRGAKFGYYRSITTLQEYILIAQDSCRVEHYRRYDGVQWLFMDYQDPQAVLALASIGCSLYMQDVYARLNV